MGCAVRAHCRAAGEFEFIAPPRRDCSGIFGNARRQSVCDGGDERSSAWPAEWSARDPRCRRASEETRMDDPPGEEPLRPMKHECTMRGEPGRCASGSAGVPPAVFRVPRNTPGRRKRLIDKLTSAGCVARQAGRPRHPRHAVLFLDACVNLKKPRNRHGRNLRP